MGRRYEAVDIMHCRYEKTRNEDASPCIGMLYENENVDSIMQGISGEDTRNVDSMLSRYRRQMWSCR